MGAGQKPCSLWPSSALLSLLGRGDRVRLEFGPSQMSSVLVQPCTEMLSSGMILASRGSIWKPSSVSSGLYCWDANRVMFLLPLLPPVTQSSTTYPVTNPASVWEPEPSAQQRGPIQLSVCQYVKQRVISPQSWRSW